MVRPLRLAIGIGVIWFAANSIADPTAFLIDIIDAMETLVGLDLDPLREIARIVTGEPVVNAVEEFVGSLKETFDQLANSGNETVNGTANGTTTAAE